MVLPSPKPNRETLCSLHGPAWTVLFCCARAEENDSLPWAGGFSCGAGAYWPAWNKNASRGAVTPSISIRAGGVSATPPASFLCVLYFLGIRLQNKFVKERTKTNEETHCIAASDAGDGTVSGTHERFCGGQPRRTGSCHRGEHHLPGSRGRSLGRDTGGGMDRSG